MSPSERTRLDAIVAELEPDAIRVLTKIAERLLMGRKQYGDLCIATDRRNWRKQTSEELLDAVAYLAIETLDD